MGRFIHSLPNIFKQFTTVFYLFLIISPAKKCHSNPYNYNSNAEELAYKIFLVDFDLIDMCENMSNNKNSINNQINTNTDINVLNNSYTKFQGIISKMDDLLLNGSKDVTDATGFDDVAHFLKLPLRNFYFKSLLDRKSSWDMEQVRNFQKIIEKRRFLLEYDTKFLKCLSKNRKLSTLKAKSDQFSSIFLNNNIDFVDKYFSITLNMLTNVQNDSHDIFAEWDSMLDLKFLNFERREQVWNQTKFLYEALMNFVQKRLSQKYSLSNETDAIPLYLLGTPLGDDWTNILDIVLPYPELLNSSIFDNKVNTDQIISEMKQLFDYMKLKVDVLSNYEICPISIINFCATSASKFTLCSKLRPSDYFDLFEGYIGHRMVRKNFTLSLINDKTRISVLNEAVSGISSLIMAEKLLVDVEIDSHNHEMTKRLILALRFLPKLAYYYLVDEWRFQLLLNQTETFRNDFNEVWYNQRLDIENIEDTNWSFLYDSNVILNKPYVGKFFAIIVQFQLMELIKNNHNGMDFLKNYGDYLNKLARGHNDVNYIMEDLNVEYFIDYFTPLIKFMENAPDYKEIETATDSSELEDEAKSATEKNESNLDFFLTKSTSHEMDEMNELNETEDFDESDFMEEMDEIFEPNEFLDISFVGLISFVVSFTFFTFCIVVIYFMTTANLRSHKYQRNRRFS
uniref:Angiotensin-converting enzyme n=1 Tax=Cuerna arida TaxID=1464854 RepID=A0A1B6FBL2_9HEMI